MKQLLMIISLLYGSLAAYPHDSIKVLMQCVIENDNELIKINIANNNQYPVHILNRGRYNEFGQPMSTPISYWKLIGFISYESPEDFIKFHETREKLFFHKESVGRLKSFTIDVGDTFEYGPAWLFSGSEYSYSVFPDSAKQHISKMQVKVFLTYYYYDESTSTGKIYKKEFLSNVVTK